MDKLNNILVARHAQAESDSYAWIAALSDVPLGWTVRGAISERVTILR